MYIHIVYINTTNILQYGCFIENIKCNSLFVKILKEVLKTNYLFILSFLFDLRGSESSIHPPTRKYESL